MKWLKIGLGILAFFLLLIGIAIVAITQWIDPNQYKSEITAAIEQNVGRKLTIKGDIQLSFFPWLGLKLGSTTLNNPSDFAQQPFAAIQQAQLKVKLLPLFSQQIEIGQIQFDGLQLLLIQREDGSNNWQDLTQTTENSDNTTTETKNVYLENLQIKGVSLKNSSIIFLDEKQQTSYALQDLNLHTSAITLDKKIQIKLNTLLNASQLQHATNIQLDTDIQLEQQIFQFENTQLALHSKQLADELNVNVSSAKLDMNQQTISIPQAIIQILHANITTQMQVKHILSAPELIAKVDIKQNKLDVLFKKDTLPLSVTSAHISFDLQANAESLLFSGINAQFDQYPFHIPSAKIHLAQQQIEIEKLDFQALDARLQLNQLKLTDFTQPNISTGVELTDFNLKKWLPLFKLPSQNTLDKSALTQVNLKADLTANLQQLQLQNVAMQLDQTHIKGQITLTDFANPRISLSLEADKLDADRYMPPANPNQKPTQPLLPLELLKVLNIKGHIKLRKLTVTQMQLQDINLQFIE